MKGISMKTSVASRTLWISLAAVVLSPLLVLVAAADRVQVVRNDAAQRVDITIDGKPFTSYIYPGGALKKPVLYPIRTARGTPVTRGFPLDPHKNERVDHPHHVGLWFNHGDVNGLDFWNNSDAIPAAQAGKYGTIAHTRIISAKGGADSGELVVESSWITPDKKQILKEETRFVFRGGADTRSIDRATTLTALDVPVVLKDNKEGVFGLRVARELEQPENRAQLLVDDSGKAAAKPVLDNTGVSGEYESSEKLRGDAVWSTRARWTVLRGTIGTEPISIAMLDNPANFGFPTRWHARGYGLFAANPLGQKVFQADQPEVSLSLEPGKSVTFRYRVLILNGTVPADAIEREYKTFAGPAGSR